MSTRNGKFYERRERAADHQANDYSYGTPSGRTPDENNSTDLPRYAGSHHKLLEHEQATGLLTSTGGEESYRYLLMGLNIQDPSSYFNQEAFNAIALFDGDPYYPGPDFARVLINPQSSKCFSIEGADPVSHKVYRLLYGTSGSLEDLLNEISLTSANSAAEMLELYLMALCRGIPFTKYVEESTKTGSPVKLALDVLNSDAVRPHFKGRREDESHVTVDTLFRGTSAGDRDGQYLSQFLLLPRPPQFPSGCAPNIANAINAQIFFKDPYLRYLHPPSPSEREFMVTWGDYISVSNGGIPKKYEDSDFNGMAEIDNGRKLASLVHVDSLYEEYAYALDVLAGLNHPRSKHSPYHRDNPTAVNEGDGPTLGIPDAAGLIGAVALEAARAAWVQKWIVARRARPEVMAAYIHQIASDPTFPVKLHSIVSSPNAEVEVLYDAIRDHNMRSVANAPEGRTLLLSQVFPEGAPGHPAWPSGHATIAGACVTVLKAIFDDEVDFEVDGQNYNLGRELDKLASNVAFGRSFAGVHYRSDGEHGIVLGEAVALRFLQDHLRTYREDFEGCGSERCFELTKRNGERVRITTSVISASNAADGTVPFSTTIDPAMRKHPTTAL